MTSFLARHEHFEQVGSTNDIVRDWLAAGQPEVCLAVAEAQTAGRGRAGRTWVAPPGAALLLSLGFRPTWLEPGHAWRLAAIVSLAMADAATSTAGLDAGVIRLKWPNDLVVEGDGSGLRKLGGVLGETAGLGTADPSVIVGIGINTTWPADAFPPDLADSMTSLRDAAGGGAFESAGGSADLLSAFVDHLGDRFGALREGRFDEAAWSERQVTNDRMIRLERPGGTETVRAIGVDGDTGALLVADPTAPDGRRSVVIGEIDRVRLPSAATVGV